VACSDLSGGSHSSKRPLLARRPLLGLVLAGVGGLLFAILALSIRRPGRVSAFDEAACQAMHRRAVRYSPLLLAIMRFSAALGHEIAFVLTLLLGCYWFARRSWRPLAMLMVGVVGGNTWFVVLSRFFNRQRPVFVDPFHTIDGPGFPSGHTLTGVTLYGLIYYLLRPRLRSWYLLGALNTGFILVLIGWSRFYLGDHYPTDVLGGYSFCLFWASLSYTAIDLISSRVSLCP